MITVVGGGPAGRYAAMRLAGSGKEVILIDKRLGGLGGQCLHQGCMVICALNEVARTLDQVSLLTRRGFLSGTLHLSYPDLLKGMQDIITLIAGIIDKETEDAGVRVIRGDASVSGREVTVNGETFTPDTLILATGARPAPVDIPGSSCQGVVTAHTILSLTDLPKKLVIIGGGVIAAEYAYIFSVFGTEVTMVVRSALLHQLPDLLVHQAHKDLNRVEIKENSRVLEILGGDTVTGVRIDTGGQVEDIPADVVLFATGLIPDTDFITGIEKEPNGSIRVSDRLETSVPGVYAAGDVTGKSFLTPVARRYGRMAADIILGNVPAPLPEAVPQAIKLRQDLAWCSRPGFSGKGVSIPGPAGPGTFWAVPEHHTGVSSLSIDNTGRISAMAQASPAGAVSAAYTGWFINAGLRVQDLDQFYEVHPSADGIYWIARYLADKSE